MSQQPDNDSLADKMRALMSPTGASGPATPPPAKPSAQFDGIPKNTAPAVNAQPVQQPPVKESKSSKPVLKVDKEKLLRALWTLASTISMTVNVVVVIVLLMVLKYFPPSTIKEMVVNLPPGIGLNTPLDLLKGLYDNFEKMDQAHIVTNIVVEDEIPVQFDLSIRQETIVVLSEPVTINGARVTVSTGGLNISNAPATVVLPAGTNLPIILNLTVPVDKMVPVKLNVPVDIALNKTDLHEPFTGLQTVVEPLYCLVKPDATNASSEAICSTEEQPAQ